MGTSNLFVEYLVIGSLTCVWFIYLVLWFAKVPLGYILSPLVTYKDLVPLFLIPATAIIYSVGFVFNAISQWGLKLIFSFVRRAVYPNVVDFYTDKTTLFAFGSEAVVAEYRRDKHTVVIVRCMALNIPMIGMAGALYHGFFSLAILAGLLVVFATCLLVYHQKYRALLRRLQKIVSTMGKNNGDLTAIMP